jgi:L-alanine-DL-glutamate epimerase-like enolase superfamily enzyme
MSRIESVEARTIRIPLATPIAFSTRKVAARHYTLVRIACDDGTGGIGFCHGGTRYGGLGTDAVRELLRPLLLGEDPHRTEGLWQELYQDSLLNGRAGAVMRGLSAVDIALWDRNARAAGLPLWRYLGAFRKETVPAYASGGYYQSGRADPDDVRREVERHVAAGFTAAKIKIGGASPMEDKARVRVAREVLGDDGVLLLDANNAWNDYGSALRALGPLMEYRPFFVEEPFGPEDVANHRRLADALGIAIATGEIVAGRWAHRTLMDDGGISILQADAAVCGGITEWRRIAGTAAARGIAMAPHSFHDLHAHLVATVPNGLFVEYFHDDSILPFRRILDRQLEVRGGELVLPTEPGLGFSFIGNAVEEYALDAWE